MLETVSSLPDDVESLRHIIAGLSGELAAAKAGLVTKSLEIETLKVQIARLRRQRFGRSSEKLDRQIEQLELVLEDLEVSAGAERPASEASAEIPAAEPGQRRHGGRRPLPAHLPRREVVHAGACACPACGGALRQVGEDITEILDYLPGRFEVVRHVRPAFSCRTCETMVQAPMPSLPVARGQPGPGLLAHVLVGKFCDHLPLYRQSGIYARDGVELDRATLADWVGKMAALLKPLVGAVERHVLAADKLHADDTPVPVLAPGMGKTKTGRLWVYLRDERPHGGSAPPGVFYRYSADRKGEHPRRHLAQFSGFLQADGYAGFGPLYEDRDGIPATVTEVACWAHVRRKFHDIHLATGSPLAAEALERIAALFGIERQMNGQSPEVRKQARQAHARSQLDDLAVFLDATLAKISGKSELAAAIRYARSRWAALSRYLDDGRLEMTNNAAERAIRPLTLGRKNWIFAGSDAGGECAAAIYTLIETAKLNGRDPEAYLRDVIGRIADHPINRIADLLPWNLTS
ncbi:MAG: IS66 family transposase [Magnetospirillum sp.]|nr:MAG: IS66 family transposase [Magnetospirillum sp.]